MGEPDPQNLVLEPGAEIKPHINLDQVKLLAKKLYGISVLEVIELNGYDDRNYKILEDFSLDNPVISDRCRNGYVLKIMNSLDTRNLNVIEAQNEIMNFLNAQSISCPKPVRNVHGHLYSVETLSGKRHAVRLLEFIPGVLLKDVPKTDALLYQLGEFVGHLDNKLQYFNHSGLVHREHIWMLSKVPDLDKFKYVIKDSEKLKLAEEVIEEFKSEVIPQLHCLGRGVIHGDVNEMNVLVAPGQDSSEFHISSIIDFGDSQYSYQVFEVAIAITYMVLMTRDPHCGGPLLGGYFARRKLPDHECRLLKTLVSARLVQSLILGAYSLQQDPDNAYVSSTEKAGGWEMLSMLRSPEPSKGADPTDWKTIAEEYLRMKNRQKDRNT